MARSFAGDASHYLSNAAGSPVATNRLTVACWAKLTGLSRGDMVTCWSTAVAAGDQYDLLHGLSSGKAEMFVSSGSAFGRSGSSTTTLTTGVWYHLAGTFDGTTVAVWVNGT